MKKNKKISGTKEWAVSSINCALGCRSSCRYCYARANAIRFKKSTLEDWPHPIVLEKEVNKKRKKVDGTIMFPTVHDILPEILEPCLTVLGKLLDAGNTVLVTSKPHLVCIEEICHRFALHNISGTNRVFFRFTIGSFNHAILKYWEGGAPTFSERLESLWFAFKMGFRTSVSCEPMLDADNIATLFDMLKPVVTDSIWIGKMNRVRQRVPVLTEEDEKMVSAIEKSQTDEKIWKIYEKLKNEPLVRWKESIKSIIGLPLAQVAGEDK